ncbi:MAG: hypothetical protein OEZ04_01855 [Nitrospinota bacterium]|nr:hypothetical protein [Nitrospinota bacterium]
MRGQNNLINKEKRMGVNVAVMLFAAAVLTACGSGNMGESAKGTPSIVDSALVMQFNAEIVDASGVAVQSSPVDMNSGAFQFTNIPQGNYTVTLYDPFLIPLAVYSLALTGDTLSISGNAFMDPSTWVIEYAPAPAPAPTDPAPAPTDPAPAPTDPAPAPTDPAPAPTDPAPAPTDPAPVNTNLTDQELSDLGFNASEIAKIKKLTEVSGAPMTSIVDMRLSGMGWGEICKQLGVDPSVLGGGKGKK